jgi:outer membrane biosynthesis protein TonB
VIFLVTQDERGVVLQTELLQSSGFDKWDEAVAKAIRQSSPLPLASDGSYEKRLELRFVPKDKNYVPRSKVSEVYSEAYNKRISEHIRAHIISDKVPKLRSQGEYVVVFSVRQDSDGNVKQVIKTEESGLLEWDHAVEKAIWKSSPLPLAEDSTYTSHFSMPFVLSRKRR